MQVYLCPSEHDEDWTFNCQGRDMTPPDMSEWYTVCGKPHTDKNLWVAAEAALALLGTITYRMAFSSSRKAVEKRKRA